MRPGKVTMVVCTRRQRNGRAKDECLGRHLFSLMWSDPQAPHRGLNRPGFPGDYTR